MTVEGDKTHTDLPGTRRSSVFVSVLRYSLQDREPRTKDSLDVLTVCSYALLLFCSFSLGIVSSFFSWLQVIILRGTIVNRTYGIHENLYI